MPNLISNIKAKTGSFCINSLSGIKGFSTPKKLLLLSAFLFIILGVWFVIADISLNDISFIPNNTITTNQSFYYETNISTDYLNSSILTLNSTLSIDLMDGLIFYSPLENRSSLGENDTLIKDVSRFKSNVTTINNPIWTPNGKYGGCFMFNKTANQTIYLGSSSSIFNISSPTMSVFAWIYKNTTNMHGLILQKEFSYRLVSESNGLLTFTVVTRNNTWYNKFARSDATIPSGVWVFVGGVYNGTHLLLYVNGSVVKVTSGINGSIISSNYERNAYIGGNDINNPYFNGSIDNPMLYNRSLSPEEVSLLYKIQLEQHNLTNFVFKYNNTALPQGVYNYNFCSSNLTNQVCSGVKILNIDLLPLNISGIFIQTGSVQKLNFSYLINTHADTLKNITLNLNNSNSTIYDSNFQLGYNFNNLSSLGENDTIINDFSKYNRDGIVVNGAIFNSTGGKYGDGVYEFDGVNDYINTSFNPMLNSSDIMSNGWGISICFKNNKEDCSDTKESFLINKGWSFRVYLGLSNCGIDFDTLNATYKDKAFTSNFPASKGIWNCVAYTYNASNNMSYAYVNGNYAGAMSVEGLWNDTTQFTIGGSNSKFHNGSIDDVMIWNRTLSDSEARIISSGLQLKKIDQQNFTLSINNYSLSSYVNSTNPIVILNYSLCSGNLTREVCYGSNQINSSIKAETININFSNSIGNIRDDFYGVYVYNPRFLTNSIYGTANSTWLINAWNKGRFDSMRVNFLLSSYYSNTSDSSGVNLTGNLTNFTTLISLAKQNNQKVIVTLETIPSFLGDNSSGMCSSLTKCPATNYTKVTNIFLDMYYKTGCTPDVCYVEILNEPQGMGFMQLLPSDSVYRALNYSVFYLNIQDLIKQNNSNIKVGGPSSCDGTMDNNMGRTFLTNVSVDKRDFISIHPYSGTQLAYIKNLYSLCDSLGVSCGNWIFLSEGGVGNAYEQNLSLGWNYYENDYAQMYLDLLNSGYITNLTSTPMIWTREGAYTPSYPEYPSVWAFVFLPAFDSTPFRPPYNVTSSFSSVCPGGSIVKNATSTNTGNQVVGCNKGTLYSAISEIIDSETANNSICMGVDYPYNNITNYETKEVYSLSGANKCFYIVQDSYQEGGVNNLLYLTSGIPPTITQIQPINLTYNQTSNVNFSANLTDDVGLTNSTLFILNDSDKTLIQQFVNYVAGEISVHQSWLVPLLDGVYNWWISLFDDEGKNTISGNYTLYVQVPSNITFQSPTPSNGSIIDLYTQTIVANISDSPEQNLSSFIDFDRSLVGYWSFDNYNTTHILDNSTYSNNALFSGGLGTSNISLGIRGNSLNFDGVENRLNISYSQSLNFSEREFTLSLWVNPSKGNGQQNLISTWNGTKGWTLDYDSGMFQCDGDKIGFHSGDNWYCSDSIPSTIWNNTVWKHIVVAINKTNISLYLDGVLNYTATMTNLINTNNKIILGLEAILDDPYKGQMDEVMIFNRTLSQSEISALYDSKSNLFNSSFNVNNGWHNYTVYSIDSAGSFNSAYQTFLMNDSIKPAFAITPTESYEFGMPLSQSFYPLTIYTSTTDINFNYTSIKVTYANGTTYTNMTIGNSFSIPINLTSYGNYFVYMNSTDKAGNFNEITRNFRLTLVSISSEGSSSSTTSVSTINETNYDLSSNQSDFFGNQNITINNMIEDLTKEDTNLEYFVQKYWYFILGIIFVILILTNSTKRKKGD